MWNLSPESLMETYLEPMWKQGLVASQARAGDYSLGPQWRLVRPYQEVLHQAAARGRSLEQLAQEVPWLERSSLAWV
jgi:hypothetical protein